MKLLTCKHLSTIQNSKICIHNICQVANKNQLPLILQIHKIIFSPIISYHKNK